MNKNHVLTLTLGMLFTALACSGSGRSRVAGNECSKRSKPTFEFDQSKNKLSKKLEINSALPPGEYVYIGASLYYENSNGFRLQLNDVKPEGAKDYGPSMGCVGNYQVARTGLGVTAPGISHMVVDKNGVVTAIEMKEYGFQMTSKGIKPKTATNASLKPVSTEEAYGKVEQKFILSHPKDIYEIRSTDTEGEGMYYLSVKFRRIDEKPQP